MNNPQSQRAKRKLEVPVHVFVRRLLFQGPFYVSLGLAFIFIALGWGYKEAVRFWEDAA